MNFYSLNTTNKQQMCNHKKCKEIHDRNNANKVKSTGAGLLLFLWAMVFGITRKVYVLVKDKRTGEWVLPCGGLDKKDGECFIGCGTREGIEEAGLNHVIRFGKWFELFDILCRKITYVLHHGTPLFLAELPAGTTVGSIQMGIAKNNADPSKGREYKEMDDAKGFVFVNGKLTAVDGSHCKISRFAEAVIRKAENGETH